MTPTRGLWLCGLWAVAAVWLGGCGYSTQGVFPEEYRTVAVPVFENRTFYRGVELEMTEAVIKAIETRTPYRVVGRAAADTVVRGSIVEIDQERLSRRRTGATPNQLEVRVRVDLVWEDARRAEAIDDRLGLVLFGEYAPAIEVGEPLEVGLRQAVSQAGDEVVWMMQVDAFDDPLAGDGRKTEAEAGGDAADGSAGGMGR
ncbi:MAG: LptE family protein [Planctomycetota bacterium]